MRPRTAALLLAGCLALAALTLLAPSSPSYDPFAWIVWGRELVGAGQTFGVAGGPRGSRCRSSSRRRSRSPAARPRRCGCWSRAPACCWRSPAAVASARASPVVALERSPRWRCCCSAGSSRSRGAAPRSRCCWRACCGRSSATSPAGAERRSRSASRRRWSGRRRGRSSRSTPRGVGAPAGRRASAGCCSAALRSSRCCGSACPRSAAIRSPPARRRRAARGTGSVPGRRCAAGSRWGSCPCGCSRWRRSRCARTTARCARSRSAPPHGSGSSS